MVAVVIAVAAILWAIREFSLRRQMSRDLARLMAERARPEPAPVIDRDQFMFDQHARMNELTIAKLTAEVEILQTQSKHRSSEADRIEAGKEYHELMVEKTRLEMDSLRLHIAEQRRRIEDWRAGND